MSATRASMSRVGLPWRVLLAAISGGLLALAFPPFGASLLAPIAVALLVLATYDTTAWRGALIGASSEAPKGGKASARRTPETAARSTRHGRPTRLMLARVALTSDHRCRR